MSIDLVLDRLDPKQRQRAIVIHNAVVKCTKAYNSESTAANLRDLKAAEAEWERIVAAAMPGIDENQDRQQDDRFENRLEAWNYLKDSGWQIGRSQFYTHCSEGRLLRERDGSYRRDRVDKYAELHCRRIETGERVNDTLSRMAEEKARTELDREKVRLEKEQHDMAIRKGEYVPRDEVELMIVGRAVAMLAHLKAMVQMRAGDLIELVEGKQDRAQELIAVLGLHVEETLSVFARDVEFEVIFEKNGNAVADEVDQENEDEQDR